jgi:hypothetical protein
MSYRNRNRNRNIDNYTTHVNRKQVKNPLIISDSLKNLLLRIMDLGNDTISKRIIEDSNKNSVPTRISWLNLTDSNDYISYTIPDKVKKPEDAWDKKNRQVSEIKKLIKKIYKNEFSNSQIKTFISKFRKIYSDLKTEKEYHKKTFKNEKLFNNNKIIDNLLLQTELNELNWTLLFKNNNYEKYSTNIYITEYKYVLVELYYMGKNSFITLNLVDKNKVDKKFIKNIQDPDAIWILLDSIKKDEL